MEPPGISPQNAASFQSSTISFLFFCEDVGLDESGDGLVFLDERGLEEIDAFLVCGVFDATIRGGVIECFFGLARTWLTQRHCRNCELLVPATHKNQD